MLRMLANVAGPSLSMSIVLVLPGAIVTGTLTSGDEWFEAWTKQIRNAGEHGKMFADLMTKFVSELGMYLIDDDLPEKDRSSKLHLMNAHIRSGEFDAGPMLVRVRIDSVSAWSLGTTPPERP